MYKGSPSIQQELVGSRLSGVLHCIKDYIIYRQCFSTTLVLTEEVLPGIDRETTESQ